MIEIYSQQDYYVAKKSRDKFLKIFFITLAILLAINITVLVIYTQQEFNTPYKAPMLAFNILTDAIYAVIYYILFAIKYKRVASYLKLLKDIHFGIKEESSTNTVSGIDSSIKTKDGVDFISLVVLDWSKKKSEFFERHILLDVEKPIPELKKGDVIKHKTHANVLVAYELCSSDIFEF